MYADTLKILEQMRSESYRPDIVAPCLLGGDFSGMIIAKKLKIKVGHYIPIDIVRESEGGSDNRYLANVVAGPIEGSSVLIVEDDIPTGKGIVFAEGIFKARGAREIKTAALYVKPDTRQFADFFAEVLDQLPDYEWKRFHDGDRK